LKLNLTGRDPIDGLTDVPYEKGYLFLRRLEAVYGRPAFDAFLKKYFDAFAFKSVTTSRFLEFLEEHLLNTDLEKAKTLKLDDWMRGPGIPKDAPTPDSDALAKAEDAARQYAAGKVDAAQLPVKDWTPQQWFHFLASLPEPMLVAKLRELDDRFKLTATGNSEVLFQWLLVSLKAGDPAIERRLEQFLTEQGRRRFLEPLYRQLAKTEAGKERAIAIYRVARSGYHPISIDTIDPIVGWNPKK
jgi:hypothetical protein